MSVREIALLGRIDGAGCPTQRELEARSGQSVDRTLRRLHGKGLVEQSFGGVIFRGREVDRGLECRWTLTTAGRIALKVADGRDCDWCDRGGTYIYFCGRHREIGEQSAETEPSNKGSLHGLMSSGKIKPRQPNEVAP